MRKPSGKRLPHGATLSMLESLAIKLSHQRDGLPVMREDFVRHLKLPETTIDDRLRTLVKSGRLLRVGRGQYLPAYTQKMKTMEDVFLTTPQPYCSERHTVCEEDGEVWVQVVTWRKS